MKSFSTICILSLILIFGCNPKNNDKGVIEVKKVIRNNREIDLTSITRTNVMVSDTFFLIKKEFPNWDTPYYVHHFRTYENKYYESLIPKVRYKNFSLTNNPYSSIDKKKHTYTTDIKDFPTLWTELVYFGEEYYLKYPSDFCWLNQKIVTDSCLIQKTCEGPLPIRIKEISKIRANQYILKFDHHLQESKYTTVTIIDSIRGIAIWENSKNQFELLADVSKFYNLPIVKADCNGNKCGDEIESEKIHYTKLINDAM